MRVPLKEPPKCFQAGLLLRRQPQLGCPRHRLGVVPVQVENTTAFQQGTHHHSPPTPPPRDSLNGRPSLRAAGRPGSPASSSGPSAARTPPPPGRPAPIAAGDAPRETGRTAPSGPTSPSVAAGPDS